MKKLLMIGFVFCLSAMTLFAGWQYDGNVFCGWETATNEWRDGVNLYGLKNPYGVTVDQEGNIWAAAYYQRYYYDFDPVTGEYILDDEGNKIRVWPDDIEVVVPGGSSTGEDTTIVVGTYPIFIMNTDGTIDILQFIEWEDGTPDTLLSGSRGMTTDANGNIIHCTSDGTVWQFDALTRKVKATYALSGGAPARPAADEWGYIYCPDLFGGNPIDVLDCEDMTLYTQVTDNQPCSVTRGITCNPSGNDVFVGCNGAPYGVLHYHSDDGPDGTYALVDTIFNEWATETDTFDVTVSNTTWDPAGYLWISTFTDVAFKAMWKFDPENDWALLDSSSFDFPSPADTTDYGYSLPQFVRCPRDIHFSNDGLEMYIADFYGYTIKRYVYSGTAIDQEPAPGVATKFALKQNYPNPFNPVTVIPFRLEKESKVKLTIYDISGHELGVIVNGNVKPGSYEIPFEAGNLSSGTYIYTLEVDGKQLSKKMILLK